MTEPAVELFCAYSHKDESLRDELQTHLAGLIRAGIISAWHDRKITPGDDWADVIDEHLKSSGIILLLVSPDFIASDYCYMIEMTHALERHKNRTARAIPVILRPCDWQDAPFARIQALPTDARPVTQWSNRDEAFLDIAKGIRAALRDRRPALPRTEAERITPTDLAKIFLRTQSNYQFRRVMQSACGTLDAAVDTLLAAPTLREFFATTDVRLRQMTLDEAKQQPRPNVPRFLAACNGPMFGPGSMVDLFYWLWPDKQLWIDERVLRHFYMTFAELKQIAGSEHYDGDM